MTAELQRVSNGPDQVLIEEAYMAGYLEAVEHEKRRKQAIKERREKEKILSDPKTVWGGNSNFYGGGS